MDSLWHVVLVSFLDDLYVWLRKPKFAAPTIEVQFSATPRKLGGIFSMTPLSGNVVLSAPVAGLNITERTVTVAVNDQAATTFNYLAGPVNFTCNEGDKIVVTAQDKTAGGQLSDLATFTIDSATDNITKPGMPAITVTFTTVPNPPTS